MRVVVQRVKRAGVDVLEEGSPPKSVAQIGAGVLVLAAVSVGDGVEDAEWLASKIAAMRIFEDSEGKMNLSLEESGGWALVVSQFTLYGNMKKGNRPSFNRSAPPGEALGLYEKFCGLLGERLQGRVARGKFGAMMDVRLVNDGPVTLILDSRERGF